MSFCACVESSSNTGMTDFQIPVCMHVEEWILKGSICFFIL